MDLNLFKKIEFFLFIENSRENWKIEGAKNAFIGKTKNKKWNELFC